VLFRDALEKSGKVAVAKVALRQREALAALRVREGVLTLETLLWPDEVRKPEFPFLDEDIEVRSQELKMAASLIETMTEDFEPDQFRDAYREALEAVVRAKVEGNEIVRPAGVAAPEPKGQPADLTEILRASVSALKAERGQSDGQSDGKPAARGRSGGTSKAAPSGKSASKSGGAAKAASGTKAGSRAGPGSRAKAGARAKAASTDDTEAEATPRAKSAARRKASA
jgi:DNA end-binding protein Ku